jgi:hypothetical protein
VLVPVFYCFCVSEKLHRKYSRNWTKQSLKFLFCCHEDGVQRGDGEGPGGSHTRWWRGSPWLRHQVVWTPGPPSDIALPPIYSLRGENPKSSSLRPRKVPQRRRHWRPISGDRSLCSGALPGRGIAPGAISIDSTAISIAVADSHDDKGVVLPRGWGLYR